jgi:hypothetical protein
MALYYFDVRDNDRLFPDDEGTRLAGSLNAARAKAFAALADSMLSRSTHRMRHWQSEMPVRTTWAAE